ncbi:hypothetical protein FRC03_002594 [Tulasnella sp. 419]|nr:hypothetical protein FRC03_002594 [Tulasnella sp. 419]
MARLTWALLKHLFTRPTSIQFCPALASEVVPSQSGASATSASGFTGGGSGFTLKSAPRLTAGQTAPSGPGSKVLICTYRAIGLQYYKYTVGGVNVMFIILLPVVFFVIFDGFVLLPYLEYLEHEHKSIPPLLPFLASRSLIFVLSLTSVIPLSYFIGMAVASISAQSSIGMGAVINATFGSIIEIILYAIALTQGKGKLVEGSIVGSLLAGVLLMPGASMVSGAWRKKEQKFNAKSAGVTSTMLIMAIIGTLTPTMFYQTYGNFELICEGCPPGPANPGETWKCSHCYYDHPDPVEDPFYQNTVKKLMYFCAAILLLSYLIGLWFSLRTHATQIWQNPQPLLNPLDLSHIQGPAGTGTGRMSMVNRIVASHLAQAIPQHNNRLARKASTITSASVREAAQQQPAASVQNTPYLGASAPFPPSGPPSPTINRRISYATGSHPKYQEQSGHHSNQASSTSQPAGSGAGKHIHLPPPLELPTNFTHEEFTRAVAATVSALGQQGPHSAVPDGDGHGGHEAPSWSRGTSATVLLACTALYAAIAEILVDVVDVILEGSGIDEKFLGITLFALVPNTTEFMNAMSFALNGNIALSMEIGSAYALQVCLLQIPAMVGFSAWYDPRHLGEMADTFTLIFPRWDVIAIILSIFLLTYTYIEAKSNYHRGSILILSYVVLTAGFYFAPGQYEDDSLWRYTANTLTSGTLPQLSLMQKLQAVIYSLWKR